MMAVVEVVVAAVIAADASVNVDGYCCFCDVGTVLIRFLCWFNGQ